MGGIAGSQTLTLVIRAMALGQIQSNNTRYLLFKELAVGAINGLLWATVIGITAGLWFNDPNLGLVIAAAMVINLVMAASAGALLPITMKRLGIDPALAGSVVLTTITDIVGFFAFLGLVAALASAQELTKATWDDTSAGKVVFTKFFAPRCENCKKIKPAEDKLMEAFADSPTQLIADMDLSLIHI